MENNYTDSFLLGLMEFFIWAKWLMLAALVLTFADLKFGVEKARYQKEEVRRSRAVRRTFQKISDYVMWIVVAYTFDKAFISFSIELLPFIILIIIYGIELESIYKNYGAARGKELKINILGFFKRKAEIIEIEEEKENDTRL
uniref:phage holin family protein n=1 Tax=uncultured Dysgonomonas sp. TaxID=206096 RepID=UPI00263349F9|nr:phage holin family protein [uncultured Dysgonomonas sp.]